MPKLVALQELLYFLDLGKIQMTAVNNFSKIVAILDIISELLVDYTYRMMYPRA